jgi:hypothetical protein
VPASIAEFLHSSERIQLSDQKSFNRFNLLHGGLAIAALVHQMRNLVPADRQLVSVTGRFIRPLTWPILVDADVVRNGGILTMACHPRVVQHHHPDAPQLRGHPLPAGEVLDSQCQQTIGHDGLHLSAMAAGAHPQHLAAMFNQHPRIRELPE